MSLRVDVLKNTEVRVALGQGLHLGRQDPHQRHLDVVRPRDGPAVAPRLLAGLRGDPPHLVLQEEVDHPPGRGGDGQIGVDLLQDLLDVERASLLAPH